MCCHDINWCLGLTIVRIIFGALSMLVLLRQVSEPQCGAGLALMAMGLILSQVQAVMIQQVLSTGSCNIVLSLALMILSSYGHVPLLAIGVSVMIQHVLSTSSNVYILGTLSSSLATCIISIVITTLAACLTLSITTYGAQAQLLAAWALLVIGILMFVDMWFYGNYNSKMSRVTYSSGSSSKGGDTEVTLVPLNPGVSKVHDGVAMNSFLI